MITRRILIKSAALSLPAFALAPMAFGADVVAAGTFAGKSRHVTTGSVSITKDGSNYAVVLGSDFAFDGAPDPKVALGRNGYDPGTLMGLLKSNSGSSSYAIPANIDVSRYNEVWIWCEQYNVPLGLAVLN